MCHLCSVYVPTKGAAIGKYLDLVISPYDSELHIIYKILELVYKDATEKKR